MLAFQGLALLRSNGHFRNLFTSKNLTLINLFHIKFYNRKERSIKLGRKSNNHFSLYVLFFHFTPRDVLIGIFLLFFHNLCLHLHVQKTTFERNYSQEKHHVV